MRFRLLRRRLTISAPSMAVRSHMPWPLRWALVAIVLGFCAAIALWAFEFGKNIAGLDSDTKAELQRLQSDMGKLREERDKAREVANTSSSLLATEKATQEGLASQVRKLEAENLGLRDEVAAGRLKRISAGTPFAPQRFVAAWLADDPWPATSGVIEHAISVIQDDPVFRD